MGGWTAHPINVIWDPSGDQRGSYANWREGELHLIASVHSASPQGHLRISM
jgi:hypothetical protein